MAGLKTNFIFTLGNCRGTVPKIDEARIYNRALSADEIGQLYRVGVRKMMVD